MTFRFVPHCLGVVAAVSLFSAASACHAGSKAPAQPAPAPEKPAAVAATTPRTIAIQVTEEGYEPSPIKLKKGEPVTLAITRTTDKTCATEILIDKTDIHVPLPLNKTVEIPFTPKESGTLKYGCAMGKMISGVFTIE